MYSWAESPDLLTAAVQCRVPVGLATPEETSFHTSRSGGQLKRSLSGPGKQFGGWGDEKLFLCPEVGPWVAPSCFFGVMGPPSPRTQPWVEEETGMHLLNHHGMCFNYDIDGPPRLGGSWKQLGLRFHTKG